jgi:hypothetical protein
VLTACCLALGADGAQDKQDKKDKEAGKHGKVIGILVGIGKEKKAIDVKADGEEKARTYVPHWVGGAPAQGGGPDKKMVEIISKLKVGSRVEVKWEFEERLRVVEIKVLHLPPGDKKDADKEARTGKSVGVLVSKGDKFILFKGDGEESPRKYYAFYRAEPKPGFDLEILKMFEKLAVGSRLRLDWVSTNHGPQVTRIEVLKAKGDN